jgi:hypothetical protein
VSPVPGNSPSRIPSSRAYWELKAEQVMNRVFAPEPSIDLEIIETSPAPLPANLPMAQGPSVAPDTAARDPHLGLAAGLGALVVGLVGASAAGWGLWIQHQQALQQERNLLLIERLRMLGAAESPSPGSTNLTEPVSAHGAATDLPPPPPDEPWMQELATLPSHAGPPARVLQVPASQSIGAAAPPAQGHAGNGRGTGETTALPQLVGVIQTPGQPSTAIFQINGISTSAGIGERIGSSGWLLRSASGETAILERGGLQQRVQIQGGV